MSKRLLASSIHPHPDRLWGMDVPRYVIDWWFRLDDGTIELQRSYTDFICVYKAEKEQMRWI